MASIPPPTPVKKGGDDKGKLLVVEQVDAHGLGGDLILTDGFKGPAIGGIDQQHHKADAQGCQSEYRKDIGKSRNAL